MGRPVDVNRQIKECRKLMKEKNKELAKLVNSNGPEVAEIIDEIKDDICFLEECLAGLKAKRATIAAGLVFDF